MHRLRHLILTFLALLAGGSAVAAGETNGPPIVVAITGTAMPFSHQDEKGVLTGFNVELIHAICQRLKRECRLEVRKFPEILPMVVAGKADIGVGNYLKTPDRESQVLFSIAYWRSTSSFIGTERLKLPAPEAIARQLRTCVTEGSRQHGYLQGLTQRQAEMILHSATNQQAFENLAAGRCALVLAPTMQGLNFLQSPAGKGYAFLGAPLTQEGLGGDVHLIIKSDADNLRQQIDAALRGLIADGTHARLSQKYFPFPIL
jgi:polar amino acid transport system substrate-binding protein/arginine transport system substrate-binding protein/lysine/arginine/ornithine transport system substrate-binding protein/histidine transport system substrate-binding protein